jgi:hypothetical protein
MSITIYGTLPIWIDLQGYKVAQYAERCILHVNGGM